MTSSRFQGKITSGLTPSTIVLKTLEFVRSQLPNWRDDPTRETVTAEEELNSQLCKYLNSATRRENFAMAYFHHEERQTGRSRVDMSALPQNPATIEGKLHSIYEPFVVLEGKRLPAPSHDREREYATGTEKASGGIQRFKLGLHGNRLKHAAIIGYVQSNTCEAWFTSINVWVNELANADQDWSANECLEDFEEDDVKRVATCHLSLIHI